MGAKNERVEWELKGNLPPFFAFFSSLWFFFSCFLLQKNKMSGESV